MFTVIENKLLVKVIVSVQSLFLKRRLHKQKHILHRTRGTNANNMLILWQYWECIAKGVFWCSERTTLRPRYIGILWWFETTYRYGTLFSVKEKILNNTQLYIFFIFHFVIVTIIDWKGKYKKKLYKTSQFSIYGLSRF